MLHAMVQIDPGSIWFFEQEQGLGGTNVTVNVRMTVSASVCFHCSLHIQASQILDSQQRFGVCCYVSGKLDLSLKVSP